MDSLTKALMESYIEAKAIQHAEELGVLFNVQFRDNEQYGAHFLIRIVKGQGDVAEFAKRIGDIVLDKFKYCGVRYEYPENLRKPATKPNSSLA